VEEGCRAKERVCGLRCVCVCVWRRGSCRPRNSERKAARLTAAHVADDTTEPGALHFTTAAASPQVSPFLSFACSRARALSLSRTHTSAAGGALHHAFPHQGVPVSGCAGSWLGSEVRGLHYRLLVAKMHQGGQALTPHDEQLIPHCLRYAMDFDALGARAGGGVAMGGAAMHSMDARGGGAMHAMDAHMGDRMGDPAAIEMEAAGLMPRMKAAVSRRLSASAPHAGRQWSMDMCAVGGLCRVVPSVTNRWCVQHHPAQQLAAAQHMRHMEHLPQHHQVSDDSALRRRKSQKQAAAGDAAHAHESLQQQQGLGEGSSSEAAASTGEDYRADAPHAAAGRDAQGEQTSERSTERMQQEAHRRAAGAPSGGASGTAAAGEARSAHRQGESALEEEQAAASRNADEAAAAMADESGADAGADGASCAEGKASSKEAAGEHSGADAAGSDAKAEKSEAGGGGSGATASGGKAEAGAGGGGGGQPRFWTVEEHKRFLEAVRLYGYGNARQIAAYVKTRSITQVRHCRRRAARECGRQTARG